MQDKSLKYVFLVQGEGRGHMTQAITLSHMLQEAGHVVEHIFVGSNSRRVVPDFFLKKVQAMEVELLPSPGFVTDKEGKGIRIWATIANSFVKFTRYLHSIGRINQVIRETKPDVFLNFYDPLGGLFCLFYKPDVSYQCVGHQYLTYHQAFKFAPGRIDKWLFLTNNWLTSLRADKYLALSFSDYGRSINKKLVVLPPLLRGDITQGRSTTGDYILVYILNKGYADELIQWHSCHPEISLHCFWDNQVYPDEYKPNENIVFHHLNDEKFLTYMKGCKGYVSTAGFESICEALYLGKPVMTVPVKGHYEQACNAIDATNAGAGISGTSFDLSAFMEFIEEYHQSNTDFKSWVSNSEKLFLNALVTPSIKRDKPLDPYPIALPQHAH